MDIIELDGELRFLITESTPITHRRIPGTSSALDTMLTVGPVAFPHSTETRERLMQKQIREWVHSGWADDAAEILAEEMARVAGAPEPFSVVPGGVDA